MSERNTSSLFVVVVVHSFVLLNGNHIKLAQLEGTEASDSNKYVLSVGTGLLAKSAPQRPCNTRSVSSITSIARETRSRRRK